MKNPFYPIHIVFCVNDAYIQYISVSIKSIAENNHDSNINIYVLSDYISNFNRKKLHEIIKDYSNISLHFHEVDDTSVCVLKSGHWTKYTWYRLLIPQILPNDIERILYLDADTLVVTSLAALFSIDLTNYSIAGVEDFLSYNDDTYLRLGCNKQQYICAGVMLMNLKYWREYNLAGKTIEWALANSNRMIYPDQDAINYICQETTYLLPLRYNIVYYFFIKDFYYHLHTQEIKDCVYNPAIIHYGDCAPWYKDIKKHTLHNEWIKYNNMLKHPVKRKYKAKGKLLIKIVIWNILHPFYNRQWLSLKDVKHILDSL